MDDYIPLKELQNRWKRCRELLVKYTPEAGGILIFSRLNIYYFGGCLANGVFWLPVEGDPVLFCRRGLERARIESPMETIYPFGSYRDIETILTDHGAPLPEFVSAEMNGLTWGLSKSLAKHLAGYTFLPGDRLLAMTRAKKSDWELAILREAGARHGNCLRELLPARLRPGMSELEISHIISEVYFSQGHIGILRMENFNEEIFLGHTSIGDSANYPSFFNGPVGLRGVHPSAPYMGSADVTWSEDSPLTVDNGFNIAGYQTDKTQIYWLGDNNNIPAQAQAAHDFCIEIQTRVAEELHPGSIPSDIWEQCQIKAKKAGWSEGFMGFGKNQVSFAGHGIGLAIDEYPVLAKGFDLPLETGMTLAVEPKIGIPGIGMVGVENTFEVTESGGKCLTGDAYDIICIKS